MDKGYLTTFQVADLLSVTPDAVLKWIKSGKLEALRTPGGHYRIAKKDAETLLTKNEKTTLSFDGNQLLPFCWEYNGQKNCDADQCEDCLVYKARALNCYEMSDIPAEFGHLRRYCKSSCQTCEYYRMVISSN